jgi:DNA-binding response OmpR family regulator
VPGERILAGELYLLRGRLDDALAEIGRLVVGERGQAWEDVEEAARVARRALSAAVSALPPLPPVIPAAGELRAGLLRIDPRDRRQWYDTTEIELTPLQHRLLAVLASDPTRVFDKDELQRGVWGTSDPRRTNAVNTAVSRLRRGLVRAGAPPGTFLISLHGVGWTLTRPD